MTDPGWYPGITLNPLMVLERSSHYPLAERNMTNTHQNHPETASRTSKQLRNETP